GGLEQARVFTRLWLALFGEWRWADLPALPPEVILLPPWFPLNIYDFGCWARQTIVALTVVASFKPVRSLPFTLAELRTRPVLASPGHRIADSATPKGWIGVLDRVLRAYDRHPVAALRRHALNLAERWIVARQG